MMFTENSLMIHCSVTSLLDKPGKDPLSLLNWRPLSFLNNDFKILDKIIANRLKFVLPDIIHSDQFGFMKNRQISDNLMDLLSIIYARRSTSNPSHPDYTRF